LGKVDLASKRGRKSQGWKPSALEAERRTVIVRARGIGKL
jgi:hypothetical protein